MSSTQIVQSTSEISRWWLTNITGWFEVFCFMILVLINIGVKNRIYTNHSLLTYSKDYYI